MEQERLPSSHAVRLNPKFIACSDGSGISPDLNYKRAVVTLLLARALSLHGCRFAQQDLGRFISSLDMPTMDGDVSGTGGDGRPTISYWFNEVLWKFLSDNLKDVATCHNIFEMGSSAIQMVSVPVG
ncbi:hypothetical protein CBL_00197 [Carabus blaptoides fortunei]